MKRASPLWIALGLGAAEAANPKLNVEQQTLVAVEVIATAGSPLGPSQESPASMPSQQLATAKIRPGKECEAPTIVQAKSALQYLKKLLKPPWKTGPGHIDPNINPFICTWMEAMQAMLNFFTIKQSTTFGAWGTSSLQVAISLGHGGYCARQLRKLC